MINEEPNFLYRYRHLHGEHREWTKRILTKSLLYFASPSTFNDPFDCRVHFRSAVSPKALKIKYSELLRKYTSLNRSERRAKASKDVRAKRNIDVIPQITKGLQEETDKLGVLSFSATNKNILLWAHYAAGHTGLCLKFIANSHTQFMGRALPVRYLETYPEIGLLDDPAQQAEIFVLTKALAWQYEKEWRIIKLSGEGERRFPEELLVEVILGARMEQKDKEAVAEWVSERKSPVQLSQASVGPGSFSLDIAPYTH